MTITQNKPKNETLISWQCELCLKNDKVTITFRTKCLHCKRNFMTEVKKCKTCFDITKPEYISVNHCIKCGN